MVKTGSPAPDFKLFNHNKQEVSLAGLKGKNVVLAFFPAAFTGVCEKELCTFRDQLANFNSMNATVLGISVDAPFSNAAFVQKNNVNFDVLSDYTRSTVKAYGINHDDFAAMPGYTAAKRSVFVLDKNGVVRWSWVAETPKNEPDYEAVKKAVAELN